MRPTKWLLLIAVLSAAMAQAEEPAAEKTPAKEAKPALPVAIPEVPMNEVKARASSRDVKFPAALIKRIENEYKSFLLKQEGAHGKDEIHRGLLNLTAEFTQDRVASLRESTRVRLPTGGGIIDLGDVVTPLRGSFRLRLIAHAEDNTPLNAARVFFVSHNKPRILAGEEFGDGCKKFMEITTKFRGRLEKDGLVLFTTDQRYLSVIGGTFLFVSFEKESLRVASVSFTDARYPNLLCE